MTEEARAAKRLYEKEWRKRNPDKVRARNARYWERKAAQKAEDIENEQTEGNE